MKLMINVRLEENVVVTEGFTQEHLSKIQAVSEDLDIVVPQTVEETQSEIRDTEIVFGDFSPRHVRRGVHYLRWVQSIGSGIDDLLFDDFVNSQITPDQRQGDRRNPPGRPRLGPDPGSYPWHTHRSQGEDVECPNAYPSPFMGAGGHDPWRVRAWRHGRRGGASGPGVRDANLALDSENVNKPSFVEEVWPLDRFYDLLEVSDIVVICLPLTNETRGVFNAKAFSHMRNHALLINVTRGDIVDGPSLLEALEKGAIGGAGLDTSPGEPLPDDHPFWNMENVVVTPHTAGGSPVRVARIVDVFCDNLKRYLEGRPLTGVIDKHKGY